MAQSEPRSLVVLAFDAPPKAREALRAFRRLHAGKQLELHDAVFIDKDEKGRSWVTETVDPEVHDSAVKRGLWGALVGTLLAGPIGTLVGGALSAGLGALTAKFIDIGIPDVTVKELEKALEPRAAALLVLVSQVDEAGLERELSRLGGATLVQSTLSPDTIARLRTSLDATRPPGRE